MEEHIFNAKVEFNLWEVLGISKRKFLDFIIDIIKRKRQVARKVGLKNALDMKISKDEEEELLSCWYNLQEEGVQIDMSEVEEERLGPGHFSHMRWAGGTT